MKICVLSCLLLFPVLSFTQVDWIQINNPNGTKIKEIKPGPAGYAYLLNYSDVFFRSEDEGDHWDELVLPDNETSIGEWAIGPNGALWLQSAQVLYRLMPDSYVWNAFDIPVELNNFVGLGALPDGDVILANTLGSMYRLDPATSNWSMVYEEESFDYDSFLMGEDGFYYLHDASNITRYSIDGTSEVSLSWPSGGDIRDFKQHPDGELWLLTFGGMYRSADHGDNWSNVPTSGFGIPSDMGFGYGGTVHLYGSSIGNQYVLSASGTSWEVPEDLLTQTYIGSTPVPLASGKALFFNSSCTSGILIRSNEDGTEFQDLAHKISDPSTLKLMGNLSSQLYVETCALDWQVTNDGGFNWSKVRLDDRLFRVFNVGPNGELIAGTLEHEYFVSLDEGQSWNQLTHPLLTENTYFNAYYLAENVIVLTSGFNDPMIYTLDGGQTFQAYYPAFPPNYIVYHPGGYLFTKNGFSPDVTRLERINMNDNTGEELEDLPFDNLTSLQLLITEAGRIFYLGATNNNPRLYKSDNLGETFTGSLPVTTTGVIHEYPDEIHLSKDRNDNIYLRLGPEILYSTDGGANWQYFADPPYMEGGGGIYIDPDNYLYRIFFPGKIYRSALPLEDFGHVSGTLWNDLNEDCTIQDNDEPSLANWLVEATEEENTIYGYTNIEGEYRLSLFPGSFVVNPVVDHPLYTACAENVTIEITANEEMTVDFPLSPTTLCPLVNANISTPLLRRCFDNIYTVNVCNEGTLSAENTIINITLDEFLVFQSASLDPIQVDGQTYTFAVGDLPSASCITFHLTVNVSCEANLGQVHCVSWTTVPGVECAPSYSRDMKECQMNVGSYDPNDKRAFVDGEEITDYLLPGTDQLTYHIRFQNTGTDTAFTVLIEDQLPSELDMSTFYLENSSHPCEIKLTPVFASNTHKISFLFRDILLPDSTTNEPASNGFVKFSIAPKTGLELGEVISNTADIFFDFNESVRTNTLALEYNFPNAVGDLTEKKTWVSLYPNPATNQVSVVLKNGLTPPLSIALYNTQGQMVLHQRLMNVSSELDFSHVPKGLYFLQVLQKGAVVQILKVVIQ
jgi:hypothetical protein